MNGDSKIIFNAIVELQKTTAKISTLIADTRARVDERHESNLRALENMAGDMTICRTKLQELPCGSSSAKIDANEKSIGRLWKLTVGGVLLLVVGAAVKVWLL